MNYLQFTKKNTIDLLLKKLSVLDEVIINFPLSLEPDYDSTDYEGLSSKVYVFFDNINFDEDCFSVIEVSIKDFGFIGTGDNFIQELFPDTDSLKKQINEEDYFKKLDLIGIDNITKNISLYGAFKGDSSLISGEFDVEPIAKLELLTIPKSIDTLNFHYKLLAESRLLFEEGKIKLSFFTAFSAFDMFINYEEENRGLIKTDSNGNINRRLTEKLKDIYKNALLKDDLGKDQIWSELLPKYNKLEDLRNDIAHGRDVQCTTYEYELLIIVITSFILSITKKIDTFQEMNDF